ncbi:MAG: sulfurtransferase [Steroidobacteraceae bacterium]
MYTTLIGTRDLARRIDDADLVVIDCRFELARPAWGAGAYHDGHVPGALYAHLDRDLSGPVTAATGRHPLPAREHFARSAADWGIDESAQVVAYDQGNGMFAARLWWLLRWHGHARVAVLDGGLTAWLDAGLALSREPALRASRPFVPRAPLGDALETADVVRELDAGRIRLVDARASDRFAGENETIDPVAGHVPGAVNHPFIGNLDASGRFLEPGALSRHWHDTLGGHPASSVVAMCGSGVSACHNLLALEHAGLRGARLYAGSWSEWIRDPARPSATGSG